MKITKSGEPNVRHGSTIPVQRVHRHVRSSATSRKTYHQMQSLWQPSFAQTLHQPGAIFLSAEWRHHFGEIGKAKSRLALAEPRHNSLRFRHSPG